MRSLIWAFAVRACSEGTFSHGAAQLMDDMLNIDNTYIHTLLAVEDVSIDNHLVITPVLKKPHICDLNE